MRILFRRLLCSGLLVLAMTAATGAEGTREVVVSAAVSLSDVLQQLARAYQEKTGERLVLNLAASNTLARQISFGAGVDVFLSADEAQMNAVAAQIDPATRVDLLSNRLAVAVAAESPLEFSSARDLRNPSIRRIAIGEPTAVPAGVYARQYLQALGLWTELSGKMVPSGSVRLALTAVESGAADAAIVYHTDVAVAPRAREALVIPAAEGPRIVYPAALVRSGKNPDGGRRLLAFLRSPEAADVFARFGFLPIGAAHH